MGGLGKLALVAALAAMASFPARAADLFGQPEPEQLTMDQPSELGSGWYLRADGGIGQDTIPNLGAKKNQAAWSVDLGAGYKINDWLRADAVLDLRKIQNAGTTLTTTQICPSGTNGGNNALQTLNSGPNGNPANTQLGYVWDAILGTCSGVSTTELRSMSMLLNGYVDIGTWQGLTPYVGAGVGISRLQTTNSVGYYNNANNSLYAPTPGQWAETSGTPLIWINKSGAPVAATGPNGALVSISTPPNWNSRASATKYNFAWALMGGVAYALSDKAKLDVGVRYLNMGNIQFLPGGPSAAVVAKEVKVGLRYQID